MKMQKIGYNIDNMQQMLDCFTELTGVRVAYFHEAREVVTGKERQICRFCSEIRKSTGILEGCLSCDRAAFLEVEKYKSPYLYMCHIGLWEAVVPLFIRNKPVGCLMLGQVRRNEDSDSQWEHIKGRLLEYGTSPDSLDSIKAAFFEIQPLSRQKLEAAVKMLELIAFYAIDSEIIRLFDMEAVEKARHYMEANFRKRLSTGKIAGIVGLSISHFSYLFHKETGLTITRYLEKLRVDFAKSQLLSTSLSIKEIAADAGYGDQNYFSRVFKKLAGCSPANYRQEAGNIKKLC